MKTLIAVLIILLLSVQSYTQRREITERVYYKKGDIEMSFYSALGKAMLKNYTKIYYFNENTNSYEIYENNSEGDYLTAILGVNIGYYLIDGLSLEPEIILHFANQEPSFSIIGNLSYTFSLSQKRIFPYIKLGVGHGFVSKDHNYSYYENDKNSGFLIINAVIGFKARLSQDFGYKIEINYKDYNLSHEYSAEFGRQQYEMKSTIHSLLMVFGINLLF
jgi:hypothetical protein